MSELEKPIIFFDGVCNLCNGTVDLLLRLGAGEKFYFASLQGETAKQKLAKEKLEKLSSIVLLRKGELREKSAAVLSIASELPFPYFLVGIFRCLPSFISDFVYEIIASHRYQWFGKRDLCRLPTEQERNIFLP